MTTDELFDNLKRKLPKLEKAAVQVKDYLTVRIKDPADLIPTAVVLKEEDFNYLEIISAVDWLGPVKAEGYIRNPNPNVFLPDGATPQVMPGPTPGFDYRPVMDLLYCFGSIKDGMRIFVRLEVPREKASVPSLTKMFKAADWQERETFDMLGVRFEGHPNLTKILTPDFISGHPLRKDYVHVKDKYDE